MFKVVKYREDEFNVFDGEMELGLFTRSELEDLADAINATLEAEDIYDGPDLDAEAAKAVEQMFAYADEVPLKVNKTPLRNDIDFWYLLS